METGLDKASALKSRVMALAFQIQHLHIFAWRQHGRNIYRIAKQSKPFRFWVEVFCGTALAWIARYFVVNALFLGFLPGTDRYQWIILARQFVIWVVLMVSPTPGGAGLSEWLFSNYYGDLVGTAGMALIMAIFWRLITYYLYLVIGVVIAPGCLKRYYARIHARRAAAVTVQDNVKNSQS